MMKPRKRIELGIYFSVALLSISACKSLNPNATLSSPVVPPAYSRVNVPLEVPFETMNNLVNQRIPSILFEEEGLDLGNGIQGNLKFSRKGMAQINGVDSSHLELTFPLRVEGKVGLKPGGLRNLFQNKIPIDETLSPIISINPQVYPNWALGVSEFELVNLGGKLSLNVMGFDLDLSQMIQSEIRKYAANSLIGKKDLLALKPIVDQAWAKAGKPVFVEFQGKKMAFSIQPDSVKIGEKVNPGKSYQFNLGLVGKVNSHPASSAPTRAFPLPALTENTQEDNHLEIRIPLFLSYEELNGMLREQFENQLIRLNKTTVFKPSNFKTQAYGEKLGIWMDFSAIQDNAKEIAGRLFLVGLPSFDSKDMALAFREVNFYLESDSQKARTAATLKKKKIINQLDKKLKFPMRETFESGMVGIQERLGLETPIANLSVEDLKIAPEGFYPSKLGLTIHLMATGQIDVKWK